MMAEAQQTEQQSRSQSSRSRQTRQQRWWRSDQVVAKLMLTNDQIEKLDAIADDYQERLSASRTEYAEAYKVFIEVLGDYEASEEAIAEQRQALEDLRGQQTGMSIDQLLDVRSVLSPEQFAELSEVAPWALRVGQVSTRGGSGSQRTWQ
jgi:Spy/CpxP family protein refolding chaperone